MITNPEAVTPLVLLDVGGVIRDIPASRGTQRPWPQHRLQVHDTTVCIPLHVPPLLQYLDLISEIRWLTTWGDLANTALTDILGIGPYPVVGAAGDQTDYRWKARAARPLIEAALKAGRRVYWIEDFEGEYPTQLIPRGVTYIDTAARGEYVLLPHHLPPELLPKDLQDLQAT